MLDIAAALLIAEPLVGVVFPGIAGGVAHAIFKKLWDLPRESVDELEVALLKAAFEAVGDCYTQALDDKASALLREQQKAIKARISELRKIAKKAHKLPEQYVADMVRLSDAALGARIRPLRW